MQGQWNSDLNELGREQADRNGRFLASLDIEHIVASPLDRTRQTAEIINQHLNLDITYDERIMEWHCGDWSGEMRDEVLPRGTALSGIFANSDRVPWHDRPGHGRHTAGDEPG